MNGKTYLVIKWRRISWAGHVACVGRGEVNAEFWRGNLRERESLEDPSVDERIILRRFFRK